MKLFYDGCARRSVTTRATVLNVLVATSETFPCVSRFILDYDNGKFVSHVPKWLWTIPFNLILLQNVIDVRGWNYCINGKLFFMRKAPGQIFKFSGVGALPMLIIQN